MVTLTNGTTTLTPARAEHRSWSRPPGTIVHDIIDAPAPSYSVADAGLRQGTLVLTFTTQAEADAAEAALSAAAVWTYTDPDTPSRSVRFVVSDPATYDLDQVTQKHVQVTIPYREVPA